MYLGLESERGEQIMSRDSRPREWAEFEVDSRKNCSNVNFVDGITFSELLYPISVYRGQSVLLRQRSKTVWLIGPAQRPALL